MQVRSNPLEINSVKDRFNPQHQVSIMQARSNPLEIICHCPSFLKSMNLLNCPQRILVCEEAVVPLDDQQCLIKIPNSSKNRNYKVLDGNFSEMSML
jgi:hypothetical protein